MRKIVTVLEGNWPDGSGRGVEYVNILANSILRNLPEEMELDFICFTDKTEGLLPCIKTRPLPPELKGRGWFNKLYMFKRGLFDDDDIIFFFDLDTVISGPLDALLDYVPRKLTVLQDFYRGSGTYQSSVMAWRANHYACLWEDYKIAGYPEVAGGDQAWLEERSANCETWQNIFPGDFISYKAHFEKGMHKGAKVICFHATPRPHHVMEGVIPMLWKIDGATNISLTPSICNTQYDTLSANVRHSLGTNNFVLETETVAHKGHAVIIGGGPSITSYLPELKKRAEELQTFVALNNSWRWLERNGLPCDMHVMADARPENAAFLPPQFSMIERWYATQCDPKVIDGSLSEKLYLWNCANGVDEAFKNEPIFWIGGGSTVGLRSMYLLYVLGYREFHLYGFDSSYSEGEGHAYAQPLNDKDPVIDVTIHGRTFKCAPWMAKQAQEFLDAAELLTSIGAVITIHGDGLLPYMARSCLKKVVSPEIERAESILEHLEGMTDPEGVEVGVFTGALSKLLLKREDLKLHMVDPWVESDPNSEYAKTDFHGKLSEAQQQKCFLMTVDATAFAGKRASIIRNDSMTAANQFRPGSLDFVFLDADHTYNAVRNDLAAWVNKLKPGGVLCGHDYDHPQFPEWGVKRAVDEFCALHGYKLELGKNYTWFINFNKQREKKYA